MAIGSLVLGIGAFIFTIAAFVVWLVPVLGPIVSFSAPVLAIVGIVLAGVAMSRARNTGEPIGLPVTGLIVNIVVLIPALIAGISCGICSSCFTAAALSPNSNTSRSSSSTNNPFPQYDPSQPQPLIPTGSVTGTPIPSPTPAQLATLVGHLNGMCPDTWCEGEFDFRFSALTCQPGQCTITFTARRNGAQTYSPGQFEIRDIPNVLTCDNVPPVGGIAACTEVSASAPFTVAFNQAISQWEATNSAGAGQQPATATGVVPPPMPAAPVPPVAPVAPAPPAMP